MSIDTEKLVEIILQGIDDGDLVDMIRERGLEDNFWDEPLEPKYINAIDGIEQAYLARAIEDRSWSQIEALADRIGVSWSPILAAN